MPKPKVFTQETGMRHIACSNQAKTLQPGDGTVEHYLQGRRLMVTMPPFHVRLRTTPAACTAVVI